MGRAVRRPCAERTTRSTVIGSNVENATLRKSHAEVSNLAAVARLIDDGARRAANEFEDPGGWTHENQRYYDRLLDRHVTLCAADGLYGLCPAPASPGGRGVYAARFPRLLPCRAGGDPRSAPPCSRSAQGVGARGLCHHAGLGPHRRATAAPAGTRQHGRAAD